MSMTTNKKPIDQGASGPSRAKISRSIEWWMDGKKYIPRRMYQLRDEQSDQLKEEKRIALWSIIEEEDLERFEEAFTCEPDLVTWSDWSRQTPCHVAAEHGRVRALELLVSRGADPEARDRNGIRPLHLAADEGRLEAVEYLIRCGADVDSATAYGKTPLHYAAFNGHIQVCVLLVDKGASINVKDGIKRTPLNLASAYHYDTELPQILAARGAVM